MKRIVCAILALALVLGGVALADDLEITNEAFYVTPVLSYYAGKIYAEITNNTDHDMRITSGQYELYGAEGATIDSGSVYSIHPRVIGPGEHAWLDVSASVREAVSEDDITGYKLSVVGEPDKRGETRFAVSDIGIEEHSGIMGGQYLAATVTNDTDDWLDSMLLVEFGVYDDAGNLVYAGYASSSGLSLGAGSCGRLDTQIDTQVLKQLQAAGVSLATVEAIAAEW